MSCRLCLMRVSFVVLYVSCAFMRFCCFDSFAFVFVSFLLIRCYFSILARFRVDLIRCYKTLFRFVVLVVFDSFSYVFDSSFDSCSLVFENLIRNK